MHPNQWVAILYISPNRHIIKHPCLNYSCFIQQSSKIGLECKLLLYLSDHNKKGANINNRTKEYGWRQNEDYEGETTC